MAGSEPLTAYLARTTIQTDKLDIEETHDRLAPAGREEPVQRGRQCRDRGNPQRVTRRGQPAVVVLAVAEYERLRHLEKTAAPTLADLLLSIPQDDEDFERLRVPSRPVDL